MNFLRNIFKGFVALSALAIVGCSSDDDSTTTNVNPVVPSNGKMTVSATMNDESVTRTIFNNNSVSWSESDAIWIYNANQHDKAIQYGKFTIDELKQDNPKQAIFTGPVISYRENAESGENMMYAIYPAPDNGNANTILADNNYATIRTELPAIQTAVAGSFDPKAHIMTAHSKNTIFYFNNAITLVKVSVGNIPSFTVHAIRITTESKPLAGSFTATIDEDGLAKNINVTTGCKTVVVENTNNGTYTALSGDYYIAVLPGSLSSGFTIQLEDLTSGAEKIYRRKVSLASGVSDAAGCIVKAGTYPSTSANTTYTIGATDTGLPRTSKSELYTDGVIDLGLSSGTLWATRNIAPSNDPTNGKGAPLFVDNVYEDGQYYCWGEDFGLGEVTTEGSNITNEYCNATNNWGWKFTSGKIKRNYEWGTYKYSKYNLRYLEGDVDVIPSFGKYNNDDKEKQLDDDDDIAHIKSQGKFIMPTNDMMKELINNVSTSNTSVNYPGQTTYKGFKLTSTRKGYTTRSMWLPASGSCYGKLFDGGTFLGRSAVKEYSTTANYWSRNLETNSYQKAYLLQYPKSSSTSTNAEIELTSERRYAGCTIRPVVNK